MSRQAIDANHLLPLATAFYGGAHRGKVIQLHMGPLDLESILDNDVYDRDSELVSTLRTWLRQECANAAMILFDSLAEPKAYTAVEVRII